jgi:CRP-like cAMP-binding protein
MGAHDLASNRVLAGLPPRELKRLTPQLVPVDLAFERVLYEPGDLIHTVWFPLDSLVSLLTEVDRHRTLEVGMVGVEGLVGMPLALGVRHSDVRAIVQGSGAALGLSTAHFKSVFAKSAPFREAVLLYTHTLLTQVSQTAACNRFHDAEARLARWLLMTADRVGRPDFALTQDFLAHMLGLRRVGVTQAAGQLKRLALIDYTRGQLRILDRKGLERAACTCYRRVNATIARARLMRA